MPAQQLLVQPPSSQGVNAEHLIVIGRFVSLRRLDDIASDLVSVQYAVCDFKNIKVICNYKLIVQNAVCNKNTSVI